MNGAERNEHDHTDGVRRIKKRNGTAKNVTARLALLHCPMMLYWNFQFDNPIKAPKNAKIPTPKITGAKIQIKSTINKTIKHPLKHPLFSLTIIVRCSPFADILLPPFLIFKSS